MRPIAALLVLVFVTAVPTLARAAESADAEKLFDEGKALMKEQKLAEACFKFEQSDKLDPGVGNGLWLAHCYERSGKLVAAFRQYSATEKLAASQDDHRDAVAHARAAALLPKLSKLVVTLPPTRQVDGIEVRVDGAVAPIGDSVAVDSGTHLVEASAPGYEHWESSVVVGGDAATTTVVVEPLVRTVVVAPESLPAPPVHVVPDLTGRSPLRVWAPITAVVGMVGLGFGTAFEVLAQGYRNASNAGHCPGANTCDAEGAQLRQSAFTADVASTVTLIAGGLLVAAGVTMFLVTPLTKSEKLFGFAPAVSPTFAGIVGQGRF
jgi:hypothetical protein